MTPERYTAVLEAVARRGLGDLGAQLGAAMATRLPELEILPPVRLAHFVGQVAHETGRFEWMHELGQPGYFTKYDGRADLGNTHPGDGYRYRGRGLIQITGRANYARYGALLDIDLLGDPDLAMEPDAAVRIAGSFWVTHGLNALADRDDGTNSDDVVMLITHRVNGGANGLADREYLTARAKAVIVADQS